MRASKLTLLNGHYRGTSAIHNFDFHHLQTETCTKPSLVMLLLLSSSSSSR